MPSVAALGDPGDRSASIRSPMSDRGKLLARVGTTIGGCWRLDRLIGIGGMAAVYSATHATGRRAAFKVMHPEISENQDARERFLREREHAVAIQHPDRVAVHGASLTDDGAPCLVMELLEGETLGALWRRNGKLPLRRSLWIADRLLDVLVTCHKAGVVHRDLKPDNVFLTLDGRVKVLDFGVARSARESTARRVAIGTPEFMAPEQARGHRGTDKRADLYAVGALLWTVLSGRTMRTGRTDDETLQSAVRDPSRSLSLVAPELSNEVIALVDRALAHDKEDRWSCAEEMRAEVQRILAVLDSKPLSISPPRPGEDRPTLPSTPTSIGTTDPFARPTLPDTPASVRRVESRA